MIKDFSDRKLSNSDTDDKEPHTIINNYNLKNFWVNHNIGEKRIKIEDDRFKKYMFHCWL